MPLISLFLVLTFLLTHAAAQPAASLQYGGQTYKTVKIGEQTWMAENLNYEAKGSKCYDNNPANCAKYGRLYNWETAMKVCPEGWHLPSDAEWTILTDYVGLDAETKLIAKSDWYSYKGKYRNNTDSYGFSALPGGYFDVFNGCFRNVGYFGHWWSATEKSSSNGACFRSMGYLFYCGGGKDSRLGPLLCYLGYYFSSVNRHCSSKSYLNSVRCIQD